MRLFNAIKAFFKALAGTDVEETKVCTDSFKKDDNSHLRLLSILQQSGRLIDFLKEDISSFSDAQVGAAVRKIHQDCSRSLEELVTIRPVMEDQEGKIVTVAKGFNPSLIKVVGKVGHNAEPPFTGRLVHRGWKAHKRSLPKQIGELNNEIIHPAEVEV